MRQSIVWLLGLAAAGPALAQESDQALSAGLRLWNAHWTTFGYADAAGGGQVLTQNETKGKLMLLPTLSLRWGDWVGAISGFRTSHFEFIDGGDAGVRKEFDLNLGYRVLPGLTATLGYKKVEQAVGSDTYRPAGPIAGLSGNAALSGPWSVYGALGLGRLKTPGGDAISFKADYRLSEVGLAYTLSGAGLPRHWTFTAGYRLQSMSSKDALGSQSGTDETYGYTLGAVATF